MIDGQNIPDLDRGPQETKVDKTNELLFSRFILSLIKTMNLTGYYPADHPSIKNVAQEPIKLLGELRSVTSEVGFVTTSGTVGEDIVVDMVDESIPFMKLVHSAMAEHFANKFVSYLERNALVSFSIKTAIPEDEFKRFIALMVEMETQDEEGKNLGTTFTNLLIQRRIVHVQVVSRDEIIGSNRFIPWRVKIAISRLKKDLGTLPLYSKASEMELQAAKQMIIGDIIRPIRRPRFLKELLLNSDLIQAEVEELLNVDVEQEIIECLDARLIETVCWEVIGNLEKAQWGEILQEEADGNNRRIDNILKDTVKKLAIALVGFDIQNTYEIMEYLFTKKMLAFSELPMKLQQILSTTKWTKQFIEKHETILKQFSDITEASEYGVFLEKLDHVLKELIIQEELDLAIMVVSQIADHVLDTSFPERAAMAKYAVVGTATPEIVEILTGHVSHEEKAKRQDAIKILGQIGDPGVRAMFTALIESEDGISRRNLLSELEKLGDLIHVVLKETMLKAGLKWYVYRNILFLIDKTGCPVEAADLERFVAHPHTKVREQAIISTYSVLGKESAPILAKALRDDASANQRRAIILLTEMGSRDLNFLNFLSTSLQREQGQSYQGDDLFYMTIMEAISKIGRFADPKGNDIVDVLLDLVFSNQKGFFKKLLSKDNDSFSVKVRARAVALLGKIGDPGILEELEYLRQDSDKEVGLAATRACEQIDKTQQ